MKYFIQCSALIIPILTLSACTKHNLPDTQTAEPKAFQSSTLTQPPVAKKIPKSLEAHGNLRTDNYYWMRDDQRQDPAVLSHLRAENDYVENTLVDTKPLQEQLFAELKGRIQKDDSSLPIKDGQFWYWQEVSGDSEYPAFYRSDNAQGENKELLLDANLLAKEHSYYSLGGIGTSTNDKLLAYAEDTVSRRIYTLRIKDLKTGQLLPDTLINTSGEVQWSNDNKTLYYIKKDPQTLLSYQVYRHTLGTPQEHDQLIYEEKNKSFFTWLGKTKDKSQVLIYHSSTEASGVSLINANDPNAFPIEFIPREEKLEYSIAKSGDWYYILTNLNAVNFRLMRVKSNQLGDKSKWKPVISPQEHIKFEDFELFNEHIVYELREKGQSRFFIRSLASNQNREIHFNDSVFSAYMFANIELDSDKVRLFYHSMTTPGSYYDIDLNTGEKKLLKQEKVMGHFNPSDYNSERIMITARDGAEVPVSLVYRKDLFKKDGANPLYLYGYGSYGVTIDPYFSSDRLSLLDRGFVYAIAHIRGSQMLGRPWYEDGKKLNKKHTFNDFIDVTKGLVAAGYGGKDKVFAAGGSAGGLLMGAVINEAPELYRGVAAHVPFVDVVTTMLDDSLPLTTNEYDEWGNPNNKQYYDYMLSYSPYDQVKAQAYPNMLVTTGLHDSQVQYFEPMKWVAKLREYKTDNNLLLFKTDMEAGHGGSSGRFNRLHDTALEYAFFIHLLKAEPSLSSKSTI